MFISNLTKRLGAQDQQADKVATLFSKTYIISLEGAGKSPEYSQKLAFTYTHQILSGADIQNTISSGKASASSSIEE